MCTHKDAIKRAKTQLKVLLIDLHLAFPGNPKFTIGLPMHPEAYSKGSNWHSIHITCMIIPVVNHAVKVGSLEISKGN